MSRARGGFAATGVLWTALAAVGLTACGTLSSSQLDLTDIEARRYARHGDLQVEVDSLAKPLVEQAHTPGLVVGVLTPDQRMHFFGYGVADKESGVRPDGDTVFPIGSLSKGFLAGAAATLIQDGVLSWDDTLGELLPETLAGRAASTITLRQLATHTSGLPRQPFPPRTLLSFIAYLFNGENFYGQFDREYVLDYLKGFSPQPPGATEVTYSNIGYGVLGQALERRSGVSSSVLIERRIIRPLGLRDTGFDLQPSLRSGRRARGYAGDQPWLVRRGAPVPDWRLNEFLKSSADMHSSARDLLKFADAHFWRSPSRLRTALRGNLKLLASKPVRAPATAWVVDELPGQRITYQIGFIAGYSSYLGLDLERRIAVVVLQNSFNFDDRVGHRLLHRLALKKSPPAS